MKKRPGSLFLSCLLVLLLLGLGGIALLAGSWYVIDQATLTFGDPNPSLSLTQRLRYSVELVLNREKLVQAVDPAGQPREFTIEMGESVSTVAYRLEMAGLVQDSASFRNLLIYSGMDTGVQAGSYQLSPAMDAIQIARSLQDATPGEVVFAILEGWRLEEIAGAIPTSGLGFTPEEFLVAVRQPPSSDWTGPAVPPQEATHEGFLFPDRYRFARETSLSEFLATIQENFRIKLETELIQGFENQGLDLYQAVTLASIVQREAVIPEEQPLIASVFLNRLAAGMKLDSDPTVQYAVGYNSAQNTWWTNPLSITDLQVDSPYNTYRYAGLPPGPIANPGISALRSIAYPAETPYYYFQAQCDHSGKHQFAETYEQHLQNSCQ
jgi:UPF0755 protein